MIKVKNIFNKLFICLLTFVIISMVGSIDVFASVPPKTLKVGKSTSIPTYISGLNFGTKTLVDGTETYCLSLRKSTPQNITVTLHGEKDAGFAYLMENGYPNKSITGDRNKDIYITQVAVWWYLDETTGSTNLNNYIRNTASDPYNVREYAKKLVSGAKQAKNTGYKDPKVSASTTSKTLNIGKTKKYYISNVVKVNTSGDNYTVSLNNAPSGSFTADTTGKVKTKFNAGENFVVYVPVNSVNSTLVNFSVKIDSTTTYNKVYEYRPANSNVQEIVTPYLYKVVKNASTSLNFNIFKSKVSITKIDADTNKQLKGATLVLKDSSGNIITSWVTNGSSHVVENLPKGTYTLQETKAPAGYDLNKEVQTFKITDSNRDITLKLYNHHSKVEKKLLKIIKLDSKTNKPLAGAKIQVKNSSGKVVANFTSTNDYYTIENLENGEYTVEEVEAPLGYVLDKTPQKIKITDDNNEITLKLYNTAKSKLVSILKIDENTREPLAGAVLVVKDSSGKEIARFTTTNKPYTIENIANGEYTVEEVEAPEGYILSQEVIKFTIDDNNTTAQVVFTNQQENIVTIPDTGSDASNIFFIIGGLILAITAGVIYKNANK